MMHDGVYEGGHCRAGQANYGYANAAMDMLALCRKDAGLPALAIQWGPIADVGFVAEIMKVRRSPTQSSSPDWESPHPGLQAGWVQRNDIQEMKQHSCMSTALQHSSPASARMLAAKWDCSELDRQDGAG